MRTFIIFLLALLTSCSIPEEKVYLFSYFTGNGETGLYLASSTDGLTWESMNEGKSLLTPTAGEAKLMRDPCIIQGPGGIFHMVWTTGWREKQIGYSSSKDLINWSEQKTLPVMKHEPEAKNSWAPELFYDEDEDRFLIFWATTIPGRHSDVSDSEKEKGLNHRIYYTSTRDFESFEPVGLFFNPDFSVIDATILEKGNEYIMFLKNENPNPPEKNIRITRAAKPGGPYSIDVSAPITGDYWAEGPTTLIIGDYVYVYFDKYRKHSYGAVRSRDLVSWEDISDSVSFPEGIRHGTAFEVSRDFYEELISCLPQK